LTLCLLVSLPLFSQQRPLRTSDADIVPPGTLRAQVGFDFLQDVDFPLSGLSGDQTSVGAISMRLGVGRIVEVQLEGAVRHFLAVKEQVGGFVKPVLSGPCSTTGTSPVVSGRCSTNDVGDFSLFTKIRIFVESSRRPALALRFGFQLPNSDQARGIGTNTTNVSADLILQKHFGKLNLWGNLGLAILQSPTAHFTQNDLLTYGAAFLFPVHSSRSFGINLVGEVAGRHSTRAITPDLVGTESRGQGRFGFQISAGGFQWDVAGIAGLTKLDARTGFTFGVSRDIRLFRYGSK
jgi:hypothetical protein